MLSDLFKRALFARLIQPESHLDDLFLARRERRQNVFRKLAQVVRNSGLRRVGRATVFYEARYSRFAVIPYRSLKRYGLLRNLKRLAHLPRGHVDATR